MIPPVDSKYVRTIPGEAENAKQTDGAIAMHVAEQIRDGTELDEELLYHLEQATSAKIECIANCYLSEGIAPPARLQNRT
jgi:hypothetical protein